MVRHDLEQEFVMALYIGLFLVTISISYLTVRLARALSGKNVEKDRKTVPSPVRKQSHMRKKQGSQGLASSGSRSNPTSTTLKRSALIAGANLKPWGW